MKKLTVLLFAAISILATVITVDTDRMVGNYNKEIFGSYQWYSFWESTCNDEGFQPAVLETSKDAGLKMFRLTLPKKELDY